jgi:hypothetical protein
MVHGQHLFCTLEFYFIQSEYTLGEHIPGNPEENGHFRLNPIKEINVAVCLSNTG